MIDVALVTMEFPPEAGGIGEHAFQVARALSAAGLAVAVICPRPRVVNQTHLDFDRGQPFAVQRIIPPSGGPSAYLHRLWTVVRALREARPRCVVASGRRGVAYGWFAPRLLSIPSVSVGHGTEFSLPGRMSRVLVAFLFNSFQACVAVSRFTGGLMAACGISPSRIRVIHNGADSSFFDPALVTGAPDRLGNRRVLLTVGRVCERKGQDLVLRALPDLLPDFPDLLYAVVGPCADPSFPSLVEDLGLGAHVLLTGEVDRSRLREWFRAAHVYILASRITPAGENEGFGISMAEAALMGLPGIGSRGCGVEEIIEDGETGILVGMEDTVAIGRAIRGLLSDEESRQRMGARARVRALEQFSWERSGREYVRLCRSLMGSGRE
jgi:phosphatidylinositol alpha-1,6-mannosyltransferase